MLLKFKITKLFDRYNVSLSIDNNVNIFIGENGMGKTTILNCLYYTISDQLDKLASIDFETISIVFSNNDQIHLNRVDLIAFLDDGPFNISNIKNINKFFTIKEREELKKIQNLDNSSDNNYYRYYVSKLVDMYDIPSHVAKRELERYIYTQKNKGSAKTENIRKFRESVSDYFANREILYFPTYRRIEEDMSKLGIDTDERRISHHYKSITNKLINFGMDDVEVNIKNTLAEIKNLAISGFNQMTGILLKQYLENSVATKKNMVIDQEKLSIALERIGNSIDKNDKDKIKQLVANDQIDNTYLLNLIYNLIESYEKQNMYDERVKQFVKVCNSYLNDKEYVYDESQVTLAIYDTEAISSRQPISMKNLSSGEKQVISIFSKLYLGGFKDCIILIDEPELSLSLKWQKKFLPDIMSSKKCKSLIAVTHSPFIFDNEYDEYATDMTRYVERI